MQHRLFPRAIALSLGALLVFAGTAAADTIRADGDVLTPAVETAVDLGSVAPGSVHVFDIGFVLTCGNGGHVDAGQTVTATFAGATEPEDGRIVSVTDGTVGPAPSNWPVDGTSCAFPAQTFADGTASVITLQAPTTPGLDHTFAVLFDRSISPAGRNDGGALVSFIAIDIVVDVNTPPSITLPGLAGVGTVEGDSTGGWTAAWAGLAATDAEDDPDPVAGCSPAAGTLLPVGTTTVTCAVTDGGGLTTMDSFVLTITDSTAPALLGMPADQTVTTGDAAGTSLAYAPPSATDIVDPAPVVACLPANGDPVGLGTTTVACTATDADGNVDQDTFDVTVVYVAPHVASASWGEPVAGADATFIANRGRTIPVKVELAVDGQARATGDAELRIVPCAGGPERSVALAFGGGRWNASLDTSPLPGSCHTVTAWIDGLQAGGFRLELRAPEAVRASHGKR